VAPGAPGSQCKRGADEAEQKEPNKPRAQDHERSKPSKGPAAQERPGRDGALRCCEKPKWEPLPRRRSDQHRAHGGAIELIGEAKPAGARLVNAFLRAASAWRTLSRG